MLFILDLHLKQNKTWLMNYFSLAVLEGNQMTASNFVKWKKIFSRLKIQKFFWNIHKKISKKKCT